MSERAQRQTQKFLAFIDGKPKIIYYINAIPRIVVRIDGTQEYLWYKNRRIDLLSMIPLFPIEGAEREIHETECLPDWADGYKS